MKGKKSGKEDHSAQSSKRKYSSISSTTPQQSQQVSDDDGSEDDENVGDSESDEWSDEFEEEDLPIMFFMLGRTKLQEQSQLSAAIDAFEKSKLLILERDVTMNEMLQKAEKRRVNLVTKCLMLGSVSFLLDGKVPPGSGQVRRSVTDSRFLLTAVNIELCKAYGMVGHVGKAYESLRECLTWFPRHIEANFLLAEALKAEASDAGYLKQAELAYRKCVETGELLKSSARDQSSGVETADDISALDNELMDSEMKASKKATESLILYLCQEEAADLAKRKEAYSLLLQCKYTWKLSNAVLHYPLANSSEGDNSELARQRVRIFDRFLPSKQAINHLMHIFRPSSPFWSEHDYDISSNCSRKVGYFSYLYPLRDRRPMCSVEQIVDFIYQKTCERFPAAKEATVAEWWVHTRPHSNGHQLHFDSDETRIEAGRSPAHPIVSTVLFLSEDIGGPTLVTDQLISGPLASTGWICHSKENRLAMFDASYLHGVIPGRGLPGPQCSKQGAATSSSSSSSGGTAVGSARRLTFMVGFWKEIAAKDRGVDMPGPDETISKYSWPAEMRMDPSYVLKDEGEEEEVLPIKVNSIWEPIDCLLESTSGSNVNSNGKVAPPCYSKCFQGF